MGRVRTRQIKVISQSILDLAGKEFTADFEHNKVIIGDYADIKSKRLRNFVAGYITHLVKKKRDQEEYKSEITPVAI